MAYTNRDIVPAALRRTFADAGNFWTKPGHDYNGYGQLPSRLQNVLRARRGNITQIIYSYSTPIAWLDGDVWIVPRVSYSITTSSKHQSHLYRLPNARRVEWDTPLDEYMRVLDGLMVYTQKGTRAA